MADPIITTATQAATNAVATVKTDVSSIESTVKNDIATVEADVNADLAKTYSGKVVAVATLIGIVVGFILKAVL